MDIKCRLGNMDILKINEWLLIGKKTMFFASMLLPIPLPRGLKKMLTP